MADDRGRKRAVGVAGAFFRLGAGEVFRAADIPARTAMAAGAAGGRDVPDAQVDLSFKWVLQAHATYL